MLTSLGPGMADLTPLPCPLNAMIQKNGGHQRLDLNTTHSGPGRYNASIC